MNKREREKERNIRWIIKNSRLSGRRVPSKRVCEGGFYITTNLLVTLPVGNKQTRERES